MQPTEFSNLAELERARGRTIGTSAWTRVTQAMVDAFADVTRDRQWIHVDPERARRESPMGGPVAHGFLTVSLLPSFIAQCVRFRDARLSVNYGFDRLRFVSPVPVGAEIRATFVLDDVRAVDGGAQLAWRIEVEVRGSDKPALAAIWLTRVLFAHAGADDAQDVEAAS